MCLRCCAVCRDSRPWHFSAHDRSQHATPNNATSTNDKKILSCGSSTMTLVYLGKTKSSNSRCGMCGTKTTSVCDVSACGWACACVSVCACACGCAVSDALRVTDEAREEREADDSSLRESEPCSSECRQRPATSRNRSNRSCKATRLQREGTGKANKHENTNTSKTKTNYGIKLPKTTIALTKSQ